MPSRECRGAIKVGPGSTARATIIRAFSAGSATVTALAAAVTVAISRAGELGVHGRVGHVQEALRLS